jgi:hypothetical protein
MASFTVFKKGGGVVPEVLLRCEILVLVARAGGQARVPHPFQRAVHAAETDAHPELLPGDSLDVLAAKGADSVARKRPGVDSLLEPARLLARDLGGPAGANLALQRLDAAISIGVHPVLDGALGDAQDLGDLELLESLQREQDHAMPIPAIGKTLAVNQTPELLHVARGAFGDLHADSLKHAA